MQEYSVRPTHKATIQGALVELSIHTLSVSTWVCHWLDAMVENYLPIPHNLGKKHLVNSTINSYESFRCKGQKTTKEHRQILGKKRAEAKAQRFA